MKGKGLRSLSLIAPILAFDAIISSQSKYISKNIFQTIENEVEEVDEIEQYLLGFENQVCGTRQGESDVDIEQLIIQFKSVPTEQRMKSFYDFWEKKKSSMPELYKLAIIANAVPMTQVSVERLFSGLSFIFSKLRGNLSPSLLDDVMIIRTNGLFKKPKAKKSSKSSNRKKPSSASLPQSQDDVQIIVDEA